MDGDIEVGANGDALCYWQAKEAVRQAELRLGSQSGTLQAFEARATSNIDRRRPNKAGVVGPNVDAADRGGRKPYRLGGWRLGGLVGVGIGGLAGGFVGPPRTSCGGGGGVLGGGRGAFAMNSPLGREPRPRKMKLRFALALTGREA